MKNFVDNSLQFYFPFQFDDLSHKSSTSSINSSATTPASWKNIENTNHHSQINPSPRLSAEIPQSTQINNNQQSPVITGHSTPPSKPPRFALNSNTKVEKSPVNTEDEWGRKLYGLQSSSALKR